MSRVLMAHDQFERALAAPQAIGWRARLLAVRHRLEMACARFDPIHDLAEDIGSLHWFRGLGTMCALGFVALACWPDFTALEAATTTPPDAAIRDELRSQMIMPLGQGGESGRRWGANPRLVSAITTAPERPRIALTATLGTGDPFSRMLQRAGVGPDDAARASSLIAGTIPPSSIEPGTRFSLVLGPRPVAGAPRPLESLDFQARFDLALRLERQGGAFALIRRPIAVDETPLRIRGLVGDSVTLSARAAGAPVSAVQQYLQTLYAHMGPDNQIESGDSFDLVIGYRRAAGGQREAGQLLYAGLERDGKAKAQLVRWGKDGAFYDAGAGVTRQVGGMFAPVNGHLTSGFGLRRHPILGYTRMHSGVDFGAPWGSPIYAVNDGVVSYAGWHGGHGKYVRIEHGGGMGTGYGHMSAIAVAPGTRVRGGQVIGYVGSSGLSTGPHLHYEVYVNGQKVNPLGVNFSARTEVDQGQMAALKAQLAKMLAIDPGAALKTYGPATGPSGD